MGFAAQKRLTEFLPTEKRPLRRKLWQPSLATDGEGAQELLATTDGAHGGWWRHSSCFLAINLPQSVAEVIPTRIEYYLFIRGPAIG